MKINEVFDSVPKSGGPETDLYHILKRLVNQKGLQLFQGGNAYVLPSGDGKTVYRVWNHDPGFEDWLQYAQANQHNPHVVKILSQLRVIDNIRYRQDQNTSLKVIKLERLAEFDSEQDEAANDAFERLGGFDHYAGLGVAKSMSKQEFNAFVLRNNDEALQLSHESLAYITQFPQFVDLCHELLNKGYTDIRPGNVMKRGNIPVITDPC